MQTVFNLVGCDCETSASSEIVGSAPDAQGRHLAHRFVTISRLSAGSLVTDGLVATSRVMLVVSFQGLAWCNSASSVVVPRDIQVH